MDKIASLKSLGRLASLATLGFLAYSSNAYAAPDMYLEDSILASVNWQVEPYIGADAFTRVMRYKSEPTHPFQEHLDTFQPFVGVRLHKYFGVELGYQQSEKGTKERFFNENESPIFFGGSPLRLQDPGTWIARLDMNTTTSVKGWNIGLMAFYPICKDRTELFAKVAYANLDLDTEYRLYGVIGLAPGPATGESTFDYGHLHDSAGMLHVGVGIKHDFFRNIGGRAFINYERTSRLDLDSRTTLIDQLNVIATALGQDVGRGSAVTIRPRDSWSYGVGLYYVWK